MMYIRKAHVMLSLWRPLVKPKYTLSEGGSPTKGINVPAYYSLKPNGEKDWNDGMKFEEIDNNLAFWQARVLKAFVAVTRPGNIYFWRTDANPPDKVPAVSKKWPWSEWWIEIQKPFWKLPRTGWTGGSQQSMDGTLAHEFGRIFVDAGDLVGGKITKESVDAWDSTLVWLSQKYDEFIRDVGLISGLVGSVSGGPLVGMGLPGLIH